MGWIAVYEELTSRLSLQKLGFALLICSCLEEELVYGSNEILPSFLEHDLEDKVLSLHRSDCGYATELIMIFRSTCLESFEALSARFSSSSRKWV